MADDVKDEVPKEDDIPTDDTPDTPEEEPSDESSLIIVEDGTCIPNANSYITLKEAIAYQTSMNRADWLELDKEKQIASILRGCLYVDSVFNWKGRRKYETQEMAFPRVMLVDLDGFEVKGIPNVLKKAVLEAAYFKSLEEEEETTTDAGPTKREKVDVVEVEYFENKSSSEEGGEDTTSKYRVLNRLLRGLYFPKRWKGGVNTRAFFVGV